MAVGLVACYGEEHVTGISVQFLARKQEKKEEEVRRRKGKREEERETGCDDLETYHPHHPLGRPEDLPPEK